jgi:hypothetical protein
MAITAQPSTGPRSLWILLLLVSLFTPDLSPQVRTQPAKGAFTPQNVSLSPELPPQVSLTIRCENSAVNLVLADPENRRFGNDPAHHRAYDELPGASLDSAGPEDHETAAHEEDPAKVMTVVNPEAGRFTLMLIGARDGTYSCFIVASLGNGADAQIDLRNRPVRREEVQQVEFHFEPKFNSGLVALDSGVRRP